MPSRGQRVGGLDRQFDFRTGGDQDHFGVRRVAQHVAAARDVGDLRVAALLERQVLAREDQGRRAVLALDRGAPGHGRFDRVARTPDVQVRDQAQRRDVLDRLVGRAVFAQADRIVGEHEDRAQLHQRGHAQRVAAVVGERQEGGAERDEAAVQRDAVHDRAHAEFAHAVVDVVARHARARRRPIPSSWSGWSRSGRPSRRGIPAAPAPAPGSRSATGLAGGDGFLLFDAAGDRGGQRVASKSAGSSPVMRRSNSAASSRVRAAVGGEHACSSRLRRWAPRSFGVPVRRTRRPESRTAIGSQPRCCAHGRDFLVAQRGAVHLVAALQVRRALADDRSCSRSASACPASCAWRDRAHRPPSTSWPSTSRITFQP